MSSAFHRFADFPWEIREAIWVAAIRSDKPGAHVLTVTSNSDNLVIDELEGAFRVPNTWCPALLASGPSWRTEPIQYGRFMGTKRVAASWSVNNPSAYMSDGGLWTACKESNSVVKNHFRLREWSKIRERDENPCFFARTFQSNPEQRMPELVHFRSNDRKDYYSVVFPYQDLFILQTNKWDIDWSHIRYDLIGSRQSNYWGMKNIAIEFNPAWCNEKERSKSQHDELVRDLAYMAVIAMTEGNVTNFWFIDHCITKRAKIPKGQSKEFSAQKVFYQDSQRFREISPIWHGHCGEDYVYEVDDDEWVDCHAILKRVESEETLCDPDIGCIMDGIWPDFGVLACDEYVRDS
ncbi:hypothetical protein ACLX1H_003622 [Fusarium chlamydosporum]